MVRRYLSLIPLEEALRITTTAVPVPQRTETVPLAECAGRVVAIPVYAPYSVPEVSIAAMDGIAVKSRDTTGASETSPVTLPSSARVNTGNVIPPGFDAVVMIEDTWEAGGTFQVRKSAMPGQHIRSAGEDIREGRLVLPRGHVVRAFDIGALATYGITELSVRSVKIGIIPTGSELVPSSQRPGPGQVVESNTLMAQVFLSGMGARCTRYPIVRDDPDLIRGVLQTAIKENDLVLISAGSSAGTRDFTAGVISSLGELLFHGVAVKPGKPAMLGRVGTVPVLGLPGYPLAAQTVIREFAVPLLVSWGLPPPLRHQVTVRLAQPVASDLGFDEFLPFFVGRIQGTLWGIPHGKGAWVQMSTVKANGYAHIPAAAEGLEAGTELLVTLTTDPGSIDRTLILSGSLDPALEDLANFVHDQGLFIQASNLGNIGGILALRRGTCHAAPLSLPAGPLLAGYAPLIPHLAEPGIIFIHIAVTEQGIASRDGLGLDSIASVRFINTKRETPARILLDTILSREKIDPSRVNGYTTEVHGPQAVAAAIKNGVADAGICTSSIALANGLCFVPLAETDFELAVRRDNLDDPRVRTLISLIRSPEYRALLSRSCGYDLTHLGTMQELDGKEGLVPVPAERLPPGYT